MPEIHRIEIASTRQNWELPLARYGTTFSVNEPRRNRMPHPSISQMVNLQTEKRTEKKITLKFCAISRDTRINTSGRATLTANTPDEHAAKMREGKKKKEVCYDATCAVFSLNRAVTRWVNTQSPTLTGIRNLFWHVTYKTRLICGGKRAFRALRTEF